MALRFQNSLPVQKNKLDSRTRGSTQDWRRPTSTRCVAANNMSLVWNASPQLREAKTLTEAKSAAKKLSVSVRHF